MVTIFRLQLPTVSQWGSRAMSEFDWRSPESYKNYQAADEPDFAWECLRRNQNYRNEYLALSGNRLRLAVSSEYRRRWGLSFRR
jgi:hypothetical protein